MAFNHHRLMHIYTGDGKGKTTAAAGLCLRAAGSGMKVLFTQFLKDGTSSEVGLLSRIPEIECFLAKQHFGFLFSMKKEELEKAKIYYRDYFSLIMERAKEKDLLVLDEFMAVYGAGLLDKEESLRRLQEIYGRTELVLTGRNAPWELVEMSDYVTDMTCVKHPFEKGIGARVGIEL